MRVHIRNVSITRGLLVTTRYEGKAEFLFDYYYGFLKRISRIHFLDVCSF